MKDHKSSYEEKEFVSLVNEISQQEKKHQTESESVDEYVELAKLNLPARSEVHEHAPLRLRISFTRPLLRFICVVIIMICLLSGAYYLIGNELFQLFL